MQTLLKCHPGIRHTWGANSYTGSLLLELMVKLMALRQRKKNNSNTNSDTSQGGRVFSEQG